MSRIYASFEDADRAVQAAGALMDFGVKREDISIVRQGTLEGWRAMYDRPMPMPNAGNISAGDYVNPNRSDLTESSIPAESDVYVDPHERAADRISASDYVETREVMDRDYDLDDLNPEGLSTTTGADAGSGAAKGAGLGAIAGIAAGLASLFIPGVGIVIGGGALAMALGGMVGAVGAGAIAGGVTGYLKDQGVDEQVAIDYEKAIENGGAVVEVTVPSGDIGEFQVRQILNKYAASSIHAYAAASRAGYVS